MHAPDRRRTGFRAPALVLLAVASLLEGYATLGTIGAPAFVIGPTGATCFALGCLAFSLHLTHPDVGQRRTVAERFLVRACVLLVAITLALAVGAPGSGTPTVGAFELLVAIACLVATGTGERRSVRHRRAASHPSRLPSEMVASAAARVRSAAVRPEHLPGQSR